MLLPSPLRDGVLIRRYKRFLADVRLDDGEEIVAHCPNSGSMKGCATPGWRVRVSHRPSPKRKLEWTLELVYGGEDGDTPILVNTALPNRVVEEAITEGVVPSLTGYNELQREVRYGSERSRIDLLLRGGERPDAWVEVKNVTLPVGGGVGAFPDAVTARGTKHLRELMEVAAGPDRAVLFFLVSRTDIERVRPADEHDPLYGETLRAAAAAGVEIMAWGLDIAPDRVRVARELPVDLSPAGSGAG